MKTFSAKPHEVKREWFVIDAEDKVLGRVAAEVAHRLRGKHKPEYTPHVDTGDYIIVINADKLRVTGAKFEDKKYFRHSGSQAASTSVLSAKCKSISRPRFGTSRKRHVAQRSSPLGYAMIKKLKCTPAPNTATLHNNLKFGTEIIRTRHER